MYMYQLESLYKLNTSKIYSLLIKQKLGFDDLSLDFRRTVNLDHKAFHSFHPVLEMFALLVPEHLYMSWY